MSKEQPSSQKDRCRSSKPPKLNLVGVERDHDTGGVRLKLCGGTRMTTVDMILSASVCRVASQSGKSQPTKQIAESTKWAIPRTIPSPGPIGWPVA